MASNKHLCYVVDDNDNVLAEVPRDELTTDMRWRNTGVYIFNDQGEILLARRHPSKNMHPDMWGPSASGTVEVGETYEQNIIKEIKEELGITVEQLKYCGSHCIDHGTAKRFTGMFKAVWNGTIDRITLEADEVSEVRWTPLEELITDIKTNPQNYVPGIFKTLPAIGINLD